MLFIGYSSPIADRVLVLEQAGRTKNSDHENRKLQFPILHRNHFLGHLFLFFLYLVGPACNMTWDGWLCWEDTEAGITSEQHCPDYFHDFDPTGKYIQFIRFSVSAFYSSANYTYIIVNSFTP